MRASTVKVFFRLKQDESGYPPVTSEFLWCLPTQNATFIVDNIPFYARDISLGDEISVEESEGELFFAHLIRPSKNSTLRVLLKRPAMTKEIREKLDGLGCGCELMDGMNLLAVTLPQESNIAEALAFLDNETEKGNIGIEESAVRYKTLK